MEMTRLEQMWRLFGMPGLLMAGALLGMLLVSALPELFAASLRDLASVPLLGVNGVVIVGHGRSNAKAIKNGIGVAKRAVEGGMLQAIGEGLTEVSL